MRTAVFANCLAQESDDDVIASTFEVINQFGSDVMLGLVVVNYRELCDYPIGPQHFIELTDLITVVGDLFSVNRDGLSKNLGARLLALRYHVVLCEARNGRIVVLGNIPKVFLAQAASIAR